MINCIDCIHYYICEMTGILDECKSKVTEDSIRADEINKFKDWFEENYCYDSYICCVVRNIIKKYEKQKGESNER